MGIPVSEPEQPPVRGEDGTTQWDRRQDLEGRKENAIWQLSDRDETVETMLLESSTDKLGYSEGGLTS